MKRNIVDMMPAEHIETYVEPFAGGAHVFLEYRSRNPSVPCVLSDVNEDIYDIWRIMATTSLDEEKLRRLEWRESKVLFDKLKHSRPRSLERILRRNLYLFWYSYSGSGVCFAMKRRDRSLTFFKTYKTIRKYMRKTCVLNEDYESVVRTYDSKKTFFFFDPPYEGKGHLYENASIDMKHLARVLGSIKGRFIMTVNDSPSTRKAFQRFNISTLEMRYSSGIANRRVPELVVKNYVL